MINEHSNKIDVNVINQRSHLPTEIFDHDKDHHHHHSVKETIVNRSPEVVYHHPPTLVLKKQPTYIRINHAPVYVKSSPIVYQRDGDQIRQPVLHKTLPRKVQVQNHHVKFIRTKQENVFLKNKEVPLHLDEFSHHEHGHNDHGHHDHGHQNLGHKSTVVEIVKEEEFLPHHQQHSHDKHDKFGKINHF